MNWSKEDEHVKQLWTEERTDRQTDDGQQAIRQDHLSCQLRWPKTK